MTRHMMVRVKLEADDDAVRQVDDDTLEVATTRSARFGRANEAVVELVRDFLQLDCSIRIVSGHRQTSKIIAISE